MRSPGAINICLAELVSALRGIEGGASQGSTPFTHTRVPVYVCTHLAPILKSPDSYVLTKPVTTHAHIDRTFI